LHPLPHVGAKEEREREISWALQWLGSRVGEGNQIDR
jgi:hypothetical protein